ncbi:hypothetical protein CCAX7_24450 [Capsulimonas corticalis]|uniref:Uncharacterized protein n=2 Tax=Capsulimonas corticalis TaxID=2219043 RepID=A0A402CVG9_9BACT|nr:hypothetical protein CCAX7_24450 [Capsulimonas corticalis]
MIAGTAARAELAKSFYNVTSIRSEVLPNAVKITIQTDGVVQYGFDAATFTPDGNAGNSQATTSFKLRLLNARARVPSFVELGQYPVDSAQVSLGTEPLGSPYGIWYDDPNQLKVDIVLRFYVPVTLRQYDVGDWEDPTPAVLGPREVEVKRGPDRRSIVVTVITDRNGGAHGTPLARSPAADQKHALSVTPVAGARGRLRVSALHARLADLANAVSQQQPALPLITQTDAANTDISMFLPSCSAEELMGALATSYGVNASPRGAEEGGGWVIGRGEASAVTEILPLRYLAPADARLLFPDFLLPFVRADIEHNALVVTGSPALVAKLRRDLTVVDLPRPQVRVEATAWEFTSTADADYALRATRTLSSQSLAVDGEAGEFDLILKPDQVKAFSAVATALARKGRARLASKPNILAASGAQATLFLGQSRYIQVLQSTWQGQQPTAIKLQIGTTLSVRPTVESDDRVLLRLTPKFSTVDAIEPGTGLPTIGTREFDTRVQLRPGDTLIVSGLDVNLDSDTQKRLSPLARIPILGALFGARHSTRERTQFILLVTARRE